MSGRGMENAQEDEPKEFSASEFTTEAAKWNLALFSVIMGGFSIFFTGQIFWLTFSIVALDAFLGIYGSGSKLPAITGVSKKLVVQAGAVLRASKFVYLGIPLCFAIRYDGVSNSTICDERCNARARMALILGLSSLFLLETLPPILKFLYRLFDPIRSAKELRKFLWDLDVKLPIFLVVVLTFNPYILCSAVSVSLVAMLLLVIAGSWAALLSLEAFLLCWFILAAEGIVEGIQHLKMPQKHANKIILSGAVIRLALHIPAFVFFVIRYVNIDEYAAPHYNKDLCDKVCKERLQGLLWGITMHCGLQVALVLHSVLMFLICGIVLLCIQASAFEPNVDWEDMPERTRFLGQSMQASPWWLKVRAPAQDAVASVTSLSCFH